MSASDASASPREAADLSSGGPRPSAADIEAWLLQRLHERVGPSAESAGEKIDRHMPFSYYGLDSIDAVELATQLEVWLGRPVSATLTFDYPTVSAVATYLAAETVSAAPQTDAADVQALLAELEAPPDRAATTDW